jgi:hypothetical protein
MKSKIFLQLRDYGHEVLGQRKERRRFSLVSMRRFVGTYLDVIHNPRLQTLRQHGGTKLVDDVNYNDGFEVFRPVL